MTVISLFIPSRVRISKAINIKAAPGEIWTDIDDFTKWKDWNPMIADSAGRTLEIMPDSSAKYGATTLRWIRKEEGERIAQMSTGSKRPVNTAWKAITYSHSDSTTLHWYMDFQLRWYPWEKFSSLMLEGSYGPSMEKGLMNLKQLVEQ